jgi:hypothetical protein
VILPEGRPRFLYRKKCFVLSQGGCDASYPVADYPRRPRVRDCCLLTTLGVPAPAWTLCPSREQEPRTQQGVHGRGYVTPRVRDAYAKLLLDTSVDVRSRSGTLASLLKSTTPKRPTGCGRTSFNDVGTSVNLVLGLVSTKFHPQPSGSRLMEYVRMRALLLADYFRPSGRTSVNEFHPPLRSSKTQLLLRFRRRRRRKVSFC